MSSRKPATTRSATRRPRHPATNLAWMRPANSAQASTANPSFGASGNAEPLASCETSEPVAMATERKTKPQTDSCQPTRSISSSEGRRAKSLPGCFDLSCFSLVRYSSESAKASASAAVPAAAEKTCAASASEWVSSGAMGRVPPWTRGAGGGRGLLEVVEKKLRQQVLLALLLPLPVFLPAGRLLVPGRLRDPGRAAKRVGVGQEPLLHLVGGLAQYDRLAVVLGAHLLERVEGLDSL